MTKLILEIGPRDFGMYKACARVKKQLTNGEAEYLALDCQLIQLQTVIRDHMQAIIGNLKQLPFADGSIDEIWLFNVFSGITNEKNGIWPSNPLPYIQEIARTTKRGSHIIIGEYMTRTGPLTDRLKTIDYRSLGILPTIFEGPNFSQFIKDQELDHQAIQKQIREDNPFFLDLHKT